MKRIILVVLSFVIILSFVACVDKEKAEKYCSNCGGGISKNVAYCEHCGSAVGVTQSTNNDNSADTTAMGDTSSDNTSSVESSENSSSDLDSTESSGKLTEETVSKPAETEKPTTQAHTHSYTSKTTAPTCTRQGYTTYTCSCGDSYKDHYVNTLAHTYSKTVTPATCTKQGYTTYTCSCGDSYKDHYVNTLAHTYSKTVTPATCTKQGYTTYTCSCGDTYKDNYINPSHSYSKYKCTLCGAVDKSHAYEYLIEWVKTNGNKSGNKIEYVFEEKSYSQSYGVTYSTENNYLFIWFFEYSDNHSAYTVVFLDDYYYGFYFEDENIHGYINAASYNKNTNLTYTSSECIYLNPDNMLPAAKSSIDLL